MTPYEALDGRPCRSSVCWMEVGERPSAGPNLVRNTFEKVDLIRKRLLTAQIPVKKLRRQTTTTLRV